jgi:hypothetical protein
MILLNILLFIRLLNAEQTFPLLTSNNQQLNENGYFFDNPFLSHNLE